MGRIKQYSSTLQRIRKSKGFGIHSPFAFHFVTRVLKERFPFYCYSEIERNRQTVIKLIRKTVKRPHIISAKNAKMIFRVTNYYNPDNILQIGSNYGASSTSMLMVSSKSHLILYDAEIDKYQNDNSVTSKFRERISFEKSIEQAINSYRSRLGDDGIPYILVNALKEDETEHVLQFIKEKTAKGATVILRNLTHDKCIKNLLNRLKEYLTYGMIFSNEQTAFVIINPKLQRQDYSLWF